MYFHNATGYGSAAKEPPRPPIKRQFGAPFGQLKADEIACVLVRLNGELSVSLPGVAPALNLNIHFSKVKPGSTVIPQKQPKHRIAI
jgi:hypothetical protein